MPVILLPDYHESWLNPEIQSPKDLEAILHYGIINDMQCHPVSKLVNSVKNNDLACIMPIDDNAFA